MYKKDLYLRQFIRESVLPDPVEYNSGKDFKVTDISSLSTYARKDEKLSQNKYFIIHHTADRMSPESVVRVLNARGLGVHWVVDRDGSIYMTLPAGARGAHMKNANMGPRDATNATAQGVEVIASHDQDVNFTQALAVLKLVKHLGFSLSQIFAHGEVNSHKSRSEGARIKSFLLQYFDKPFDEIEKAVADVEEMLATPDSILKVS
jgi:N-acetyl-anhydromuramyl-L-alanine amidase AmpD